MINNLDEVILNNENRMTRELKPWPVCMIGWEVIFHSCWSSFVWDSPKSHSVYSALENKNPNTLLLWADTLRFVHLWSSTSPLELFVMFLKPFLNNVCSAAGYIILLKEATAVREYCYHGRPWPCHRFIGYAFLAPLLVGTNPCILGRPHKTWHFGVALTKSSSHCRCRWWQKSTILSR